ncbi:MAG: acetate--CoA ligase family protein [Alphaproteobacteria bacterium]
MVAAAARAVGRAGVRGAVVQPMAPSGLEILAGLRFDPQFGPTITVGLGGVMSEALADVATELALIARSRRA